MRLENYPIEKLKKEIKEIVNRHLDLKLYRIFFFGSRVTGKGNEGSDIDVGIEGPAETSNAVFSKIKEEIEYIPILYKIEIVDFKKVSPDFRQVALQKIEEIK